MKLNLQSSIFMIAIMITLSMMVLSCEALAKEDDYQDDYRLVISKTKRTLEVWRSDQLIKTYKAATGKGGVGDKVRQGDGKTPLGNYKVTTLKSSGNFHYFIHLNYPNLADSLQGYENDIISANQFKQLAISYKKKQPLQNTILGGYIGIHGLGFSTNKKLNIHENLNWTDGCIAVTNEEIMDILQYVNIGTDVIILK